MSNNVIILNYGYLWGDFMKIKSIYVLLIILFLFSIFSYFDSFAKIEGNLRDTLLESSSQPDTNIKIIAIDDESLEALGRWPWPRSYYAELINKLSKGHPSVIGIDVIFSEETGNRENDIMLANAIKDYGKVVLPVYGGFNDYTKLNNMEAIALIEPIEILRQAAVLGHINGFADGSEGLSFGLDGNGVVRKSLLYFNYQNKQINSFDWEVYRIHKKSTEGIDVKMDIPLMSGNRFYIDYVGGPGQFETIPFSRILNDEIPPEYFEDAIVLVGPYTVGIAKDTYLTPLDHQAPMYGVEIHANTIQTLLYKNFKKDMPLNLSVILLIIIGFLAYLFFKKLSPAKSAMAMLGICVVYNMASKMMYNKGYVMQIFYPLATVILIYLVMLVYRYIEELFERKRITGVFGKYVAPQVVDQILAKGEEGLKLGGARKEITALFVDIRGFTPLSERVEPEEVVGILNEYLNLCAQSIFDFKGTLDKFIGDATMAIFNAPLDLDEHPFRAVQAAWAMKKGSELLQDKLQEKFGRSVQFGIGINTGYAVIGNIGAKFRMDYTAIGDTVNTAARLESNAKPGQILISQSTYELVKDKINATPLGTIKVKGKEQGIPVYQVEGIIDDNN